MRRKLGLVIVITLMQSAIRLGSVALCIDLMLVSISSVLIIIIGKTYTDSHNQCCSPMPCSYQSTINNAGLGMFAITFFEEATYLMKYEGDIFSNEDQHFDWHPNVDCEHIVEIQRAMFQLPATLTVPIFLNQS